MTGPAESAPVSVARGSAFSYQIETDHQQAFCCEGPPQALLAAVSQRAFQTDESASAAERDDYTEEYCEGYPKERNVGLGHGLWRAQKGKTNSIDDLLTANLVTKRR